VTEKKWLAEKKDPYRLLNFLAARVTERKAKLFACTCARRCDPPLAEWEAAVVDVVERWADGLATTAEQRWAEETSLRPGTRVGWVPLAKGYWEAVEAARAAGEERDELTQCQIVRDVFGNPFRPTVIEPIWQSESVVGLSRAIYTDRAFDRLPILADALEEAGCDAADVLAHCRGPGPHVRGCWVVDLVLGKS
jgi:hypothetical protein